METLVDAVTRFREAGFVHILCAVPGPFLVCDCHAATTPSDLQVIGTARFEGSSNPDDEDVVIAAITSCGHAGLFTSGYGPSAGPDESDVLATMQSRSTSGGLKMPDGLVHSRTSPEFSARSVPAGLLRAHRLAEEVWGQLCVTSGTVEFSFEHDPAHPILVGTGEQQAIPPSVLHHGTPSVDAAFHIDFYRINPGLSDG